MLFAGGRGIAPWRDMIRVENHAAGYAMQLSLSEFAKCMNMDAGIVERWIRQGRIPVKLRGDACFFNPEVMRKWAAAHHVRFDMPGDKGAIKVDEKPAGLLAAMTLGGVHYRVPGATVSEVLRAAVDRLEGIESRALRDLLYEKLLDRERMTSTGIGNGVAVPHPRTPLQNKDVQAQIATCFLERPVDFHAVDKKPVFVVFVIVAPSAKIHLHLLSRLSFCLRNDNFLNLLKSPPDRDVFLSEIARFEDYLDQDG